MEIPLTHCERGLLTAAVAAIALAFFGPSVPQYAHYHSFADQRSLWGLPFAMDVLSNLPFAVLGAWGLLRLRLSAVHDPVGVPRRLATLFFAGLVITALCSTWYHLRPDDHGLAIDRLGMVLAFAGLLGLAAADRISGRAGILLSAAVLALGPVAIATWAGSANLLPWSVLQGGGMLLVLLLVARKPVQGSWGMPLGAVIAWYTLAKLLESGDHTVYAITHGLVSGHTLKHIAAAMAAWPLIAVMQNNPQSRPWQRNAALACTTDHLTSKEAL